MCSGRIISKYYSTDSLVHFIHRHKNSCATLIFSDQLTTCQHHRAAVANSLDPEDLFMPKCTDSGGYAPLQRHTGSGESWCVDDRGQEVEGTRRWIGDGWPNCDGKFWDWKAIQILPAKCDVIHSNLLSIWINWWNKLKYQFYFFPWIQQLLHAQIFNFLHPYLQHFIQVHNICHSYTPRTLGACCSQSQWYSRYAKVAHVHYFCTIALWTP